MGGPSRGGWKTEALRAAQADLAAAVERGREAVLHAQQVSALIPQTGISDEDIGQIERAARGKDAPPELRALAERVERGELSWRRIVDGHAMHDPGVQAAMRANLAQLGRVYRKFEEGYTIDDVLESEVGRASRRSTDDDDGGTVLKHSSW
jgi:hypothetical protein